MCNKAGSVGQPLMLNFTNNFYHLAFSDYCLHLYCFVHNVSTDVSGLQVFLVELRSLRGTSNLKLYLIHGFGSKFRGSSEFDKKHLKKGRRKHRPKQSEYYDNDENNSLKILNDKNHYRSSQKFRQCTSNCPPV